MSEKTKCYGINKNYRNMLKQLNEWKNIGGYIYDTENAMGELMYHGYEVEDVHCERQIFNKIENAYNELVKELKNASGE